MKRALLALTLLLATTASAAPEKWWDAYARGVAAVKSSNYKVASEALQKAIAEMPNEATNLRAGKQLITYVPHFWLGIAKFNLKDVDGALREWKISADQGVVARTEYYASMQDWVARAQTEKQRNAQNTASAPKKAADTAISKALEGQLEALSAGGDRAESYLAAQRKLMEARTQFQKAGTDVNAYKTAEQIAQQAATLFDKAAAEGRKLKAARAATPPPAPKKVVVAQALPIVQPAKVEPAPSPAPQPKTETAPPPPPVITEAEVQRRIAEQEAKKIPSGTIPSGATGSQPVVVVTAPAPAPASAPDLRPAFRAYASGDLSASEQILTRIVNAQPAAAEAYLLRGCARYTRAMLSRTPDPLLVAATNDFRAALQRNRALRLDRNAFSPKLVAFFENVRNAR